MRRSRTWQRRLGSRYLNELRPGWLWTISWRESCGVFLRDEDDVDALVELHTDALVETICEQVVAAADGAKDISAVGVAVPGLVKNGVVEEAPNLPQLKGARMEELLAAQLRTYEIKRR